MYAVKIRTHKDINQACRTIFKAFFPLFKHSRPQINDCIWRGSYKKVAIPQKSSYSTRRLQSLLEGFRANHLISCIWSWMHWDYIINYLQQI